MKPVIRTASFFTTWLAEFLRQPLLLFGLVVGPFAILIIFGQGVDYSGIRPEVIVVQGNEPDHQLRPLPEEIDDYVEVVAETTDLNAAIEQLRQGDVDGVAIIPPDPEGTVTSGEQIPVQIFTSDIDPVSIQFTEAYLLDQVAELNQNALAEAIQDAQASVGDVEAQVASAREYIAAARGAGDDVETVRRQIDEVQALLGPLGEATDAVVAASTGISFVLPGIGSPRAEIVAFREQVEELSATVDSLDRQLQDADEQGFPPTDQELDEIDSQLESIASMARTLTGIPADVLSAPFVLELENVAPFEPDFAGYFSPAVLVLLLQHLGISLAALSMTRVRLFGLMGMLRAAPIRSVEIVNGNYLSYAIVLVLVALAGLLTMYFVIDVPIYGSYLHLAGIIGLLVLVALGAGFVVSMLTASEQQAAQVAMLVLLGAVFFSGLVVSLERIAWPMKAVSFALPSTYAIRTTQDVMLRGVLRHPEDLAILAGAAVILYALTLFMLRRQLRPE